MHTIETDFVDHVERVVAFRVCLEMQENIPLWLKLCVEIQYTHNDSSSNVCVLIFTKYVFCPGNYTVLFAITSVHRLLSSSRLRDKRTAKSMDQ